MAVEASLALISLPWLIISFIAAAGLRVAMLRMQLGV